jgi:hypothetical protein
LRHADAFVGRLGKPVEARDLVHFIHSRSPKYVKNRAGTPTPTGKGAM